MLMIFGNTVLRSTLALGNWFCLIALFFSKLYHILLTNRHDASEYLKLWIRADPQEYDCSAWKIAWIRR